MCQCHHITGTHHPINNDSTISAHNHQFHFSVNRDKGMINFCDTLT